jgi:hypothetical protein
MSWHIPKGQYSFLAGKRGLVVGIPNDQSIAYGCARAFRDAGADLAVTYLNEKARPYVEPRSGTDGGRPRRAHRPVHGLADLEGDVARDRPAGLLRVHPQDKHSEGLFHR